MRLTKPSPAMVLSTIALVFAVTGSATAASLITGKQIKNHSITAADIKNHAIGFSQINDAAATALSGEKGEPGAIGPAGSAGPMGPAGITGITEVDGPTLMMPSGGWGAPPTANCPAGSVVIGTGFDGPFNRVGGFVKSYHTFVGGFFGNDSLIPIDGGVQAICATLSGAATRAWHSMREDDLAAFGADVARAEAAVSK